MLFVEDDTYIYIVAICRLLKPDLLNRWLVSSFINLVLRNYLSLHGFTLMWVLRLFSFCPSESNTTTWKLQKATKKIVFTLNPAHFHLETTNEHVSPRCSMDK